MQVFVDVLASRQLGSIIYIKSTVVEVRLPQWDFFQYQKSEKRILRHISLQPPL